MTLAHIACRKLRLGHQIALYSWLLRSALYASLVIGLTLAVSSAWAQVAGPDAQSAAEALPAWRLTPGQAWTFFFVLLGPVTNAILRDACSAAVPSSANHVSGRGKIRSRRSKAI